MSNEVSHSTAQHARLEEVALDILKTLLQSTRQITVTEEGGKPRGAYRVADWIHTAFETADAYLAECDRRKTQRQK